MGARAATPLDLPALGPFLEETLRASGGVVASVLPVPLTNDAIAGWRRVLPGLLGLRSRLHVYVEEHEGKLRSAALVYGGARPEWTILVLAARPDPQGVESAFRLLSQVSAAAARRGLHRLFATVPDPDSGAPASVSHGSRETFFQAGFYSYTRETWFVRERPGEDGERARARRASGRDAHDLFRLYASTTPHAVQRAEQLSMPDFDLDRDAGALHPPHLVGGNPFGMRRASAWVVGDDTRTRALAIAFRGAEGHPNLCKIRTAEADVGFARELLRVLAAELPGARPLASAVRSYEDHVARALLAEGFGEAATAMLFVKELAVRIEEPALATAVVR